ncbi:MAG: hypothetical protein QW404_01235 [Candidatus Nanoarchaeia archaeon]
MRAKLFLVLVLVGIMSVSVSAAVTTDFSYQTKDVVNNSDGWDFNKPLAYHTYCDDDRDDEGCDGDNHRTYYRKYYSVSRDYCDDGWCYYRHCYDGKCYEYYRYSRYAPRYYKDYYYYDRYYSNRYYYDAYGNRYYDLYPWFSSKIYSSYHYVPRHSYVDYEYEWDCRSTY